jgi:hypothetical protein
MLVGFPEGASKTESLCGTDKYYSYLIVSINVDSDPHETCLIFVYLKKVLEMFNSYNFFCIAI